MRFLAFLFLPKKRKVIKEVIRYTFDKKYRKEISVCTALYFDLDLNFHIIRIYSPMPWKLKYKNRNTLLRYGVFFLQVMEVLFLLQTYSMWTGRQRLRRKFAIAEKINVCYILSKENQRARRLSSIIGGAFPSGRKKGGVPMVTYSDLIQIGIFIVSLIGLCYAIFRGRK